MAKNKHYEIRTLDGDKVETRSEKPAAVKRADKLAEETGTDFQVFTPTGTLVHETTAPAEQVTPTTEPETEAAVIEMGTVPSREDEADLTDEDEAPTDISQVTPYHQIMTNMNSSDPETAGLAAAEWERRMTIYKELSRSKNKIVGPKMAAALELGGTTDGRTASALARRGLATRGEENPYQLTLNDTGHAALAAALAAVAS